MDLLKFESNYKDVSHQFTLKNSGIRESSFRLNLEIIEGIRTAFLKKVSLTLVKWVFNKKKTPILILILTTFN